MKSFKNHLSLVVALLSILFSVQIFIIVDRSIEAYKVNLSNNYSVIIVSQKKLDNKSILSLNSMISATSELSADSVIKRLDSGISAKNIELLKLTLPKFYKLNLTHYPTPSQIQEIRKDLLKNRAIINNTTANFGSHTKLSLNNCSIMFEKFIISKKTFNKK